MRMMNLVWISLVILAFVFAKDGLWLFLALGIIFIGWFLDFIWPWLQGGTQLSEFDTEVDEGDDNEKDNS